MSKRMQYTVIKNGLVLAGGACAYTYAEAHSAGYGLTNSYISYENAIVSAAIMALFIVLAFMFDRAETKELDKKDNNSDK